MLIKSQGIVGCTPTNLPLWEIPNYKPKKVWYLWIIIPKNPKVEHKKYHGYMYVRATSFLVP